MVTTPMPDVKIYGNTKKELEQAKKKLRKQVEKDLEILKNFQEDKKKKK